ncbi:O-antigen polymerase [Sphingobacterium sp. R2]|uniref:O-antigen polymerase n=1 Tax=Sphingobacterium sp. R2 TaxID=3112958 RepID=UPI00345D368D
MRIKRATVNIMSFISVLSLIIGFFLMPESRGQINNGLLLTLSIIVSTNVVLFLIVMKSCFGTVLNFQTFFLIGFLIVHFQIPFYNAIGIPPQNPRFIWANPNVVNFGTWMSYMGGLIWIVGNYVGIIFKGQSKNVYARNNKSANLAILDGLIIILFVSFIVLVGSAFLSGAYDGGKNWGAGASYVNVLLRVAICLRIFYFFYNYRFNRSKISLKTYASKNKLFLIVLFFYLIIFMNAGDRGPLIESGVLILSCYSFFIRSVKIWQLVLLIFIGSSFLTILKLGRGKDSSKQGSILERGFEALFENDSNTTEELASSVRIVYKAVDQVPVQHDYLYGLTMFMDIATAVPFAGGFVIQTFSIPEIYRSSTYFFTITGQGTFYTYGEGSEILGDIYINFGLIGVFLLMFLFGIYVSRISLKAFIDGNFKNLLIIFMMISTAIYMNRSVLFFPLQLIVYTLILDKFIKFFGKNLEK